jgi:tryptophan-rich sensory protein
MIFALRPWYNVVHKLAPLHAFSLIMAGFGVQVVMGNVSGNPAVKPARRFYGIWLFLHGLWLVVFAALHFPVLGLGVSVIQWGVALLCIQKFYNVDPKAGHKTIYFFLATSYWMILNGTILSLNNF